MKYRLIIFFLQLLAYLPLTILYALSSLAWPVLYYIIRYRRRVTRMNFIQAFPEKKEEDIRLLERKFYRHLCDIVIETVKLLHISDDEMKKRITFTGINLIENAAKEKRPVFLLAGHYGNWEWAAEVTRRMRVPTIQGNIYIPLASETANHVMVKIRSHYHAQLIPKNQAARTILQMKRSHDSYFIGFIADQRPSRHSLHHWITFMRQDTPYMVGAEQIGRHVNAVCLYLHVEQPLRGYYSMDIQELQPVEGEKFPYTVAYMQQLEKDIYARPELWLWTHKRWKHKRPT